MEKTTEKMKSENLISSQLDKDNIMEGVNKTYDLVVGLEKELNNAKSAISRLDKDIRIGVEEKRALSSTLSDSFFHLKGKLDRRELEIKRLETRIDKLEHSIKWFSYMDYALIGFLALKYLILS